MRQKVFMNRTGRNFVSWPIHTLMNGWMDRGRKRRLSVRLSCGGIEVEVEFRRTEEVEKEAVSMDLSQGGPLR